MRRAVMRVAARAGTVAVAAVLAWVALTETMPYRVTHGLPTGHTRPVAVTTAVTAPGTEASEALASTPLTAPAVAASCPLGWYTNISRENGTLHYNWDVNTWYSTMMWTSGCGLVTLSNFYVFGNQPWENPCAFVRLHAAGYVSPFTYLCGPNGWLPVWMPRGGFYVEYKLPWSTVDASQAWIYGAFTVGH